VTAAVGKRIKPYQYVSVNQLFAANATHSLDAEPYHLHPGHRMQNLAMHSIRGLRGSLKKAKKRGLGLKPVSKIRY